MRTDNIVLATKKLITHHIEQSKEHRWGFIR